MTPRFIVTGGAGFIGCNLALELNRRGFDDLLIVDHIDRPGKQRNLDRIRHARYLDKTEFRQQLRAGAIAPVQTVFHLGACSSTTETNADYLEDNNVAYTRDLCEWSIRNGSRFIYASSAATYGDGSRGYSDNDAITPTLEPLNLYGLSKQKFDLWAMANNRFDRIVGLKYFNVYGPYEDHKEDMRSVVNKAYQQILNTGEITLFKSHHPDYRDGCQLRDFVYVRDAVAVTLFFHDHPERSGLFNCGTGTARTWLDLAHALFAAMRREPHIRFIDMPESIRDKYQYYTQADDTKLRTTGYTAPFTPIEDAVHDYVTRFLSNPAY
jgi:ADP-L-glycero-D-manno-heptose 6-epimerase